MKCLSVLALAAVLAPAAGQTQTLDEVISEAGESVQMVICAGYFGVTGKVAEMAGTMPDQVQQADRRKGIMATGAAVLRMGQFSEPVEVAMDPAFRHADAVTNVLFEAWQTAGPEKFAADYDYDARMTRCNTEVKSVAAALGEGLE